MPKLPALLEELRDQHQRAHGWSLACCAWQQDLAEDVLQEAYLRVLDGRATFSGGSALTTWFYAVIRRVASEQRRGAARRAALNLRLVTEEPASTAAEDAAGALSVEARADSLRAALLQLSERQREVLHLVFYAEFTLEEAAQTLDITVGSARTHYHRGKRRLAELLQLEQDDD
ncbi:MAG: hypothetical protein CME59_20075 [Halioglobus sp.]|nr:hypothetical protein [Halioglobus sp.]|tara:strand:- start:1662 stop:2183 length:522 start_codon:yes stop_codon:yes gene_type:complete